MADPDADLAAQIFVLDLQEQPPSVQRLRDWTLAALDPQPGECAVDVGSGTGTEVRRLAGLVGTDGEAIGVEPHPGLRAEAEVRAAATGVGATSTDGDALSLPFRAGLAVDPDIAATAVLVSDDVIRRMDLLGVPLALAVEEGEISAEEAATLEREVSRRSTQAKPSCR